MLRHRLYPSLLAAGALLGCATTSSTSKPAGPGAAPAAKPVQRVHYKPEVVFSSFGEVDFDHDSEVVQRYHAALRQVQNPCVPGQRTAREKLEGVHSNRECPPEEPSASAATPVKVLVDSIPEGIDIANGKIQVAEGKGLSLVGRVKWEVPDDFSLMSAGDALTANRTTYVFRRKKAEIVDELKYLARAASANLVLITFIDEKADTAHGAAGLLFHVDLSSLDTSKNRLGKVPTEI